MNPSQESYESNSDLTNEQVSLLADSVQYKPEFSPITRALSIANAAELIGISLTLSDIDIAVNGVATSRLDSTIQNTKKHIPFVKSRDQKLASVYDILVDQAWDEIDENKSELDFSDWVRALTPPERKRVEIVRTEYGDPFLSPLKLVVRVDGEEDKTHDIGDHFNFETSYRSDFILLPESIREQFEIKKSFWIGLGVNNASQLEVFKERHFKKVKVDIDGIAPPELAWLEAKDATRAVEDRIFPKLRLLHKRTGQNIYLWTLSKTPPIVVSDVLKVASTQERYISTWLPGLVKREKSPIILDSDLQAVTDTFTEALEIITEDKRQHGDTFQRKYLLTQLENQLGAAQNFNKSILNIVNLRGIALGISIDGEYPDEETKTVIDSANDQLDLELSGDSVADRLSIDTALYTTEGAKQILKAVPGLVLIAELLKHIPIPVIKDLATAVGASDDFLGLASEISNQKRQGNKWPEIRRRFNFVPIVALGMVALGTQIENVSSINPYLATLAYAISAFGTTGATLAAALRSNSHKYMKLAEQGKLVDEPYVNVDQRQSLYKSIEEEKSPRTAAEIARIRIETILNSSHGRSQKAIKKIVDGIIDAAIAGDTQKMGDYLKPSRREALRASYKETFSTNPVREGKLVSMPAMLGLAAVIGPVLISNPLFYIPFGMMESMGGLLRAKYADIFEGRLYRKQVQTATEKLIKETGGN